MNESKSRWPSLLYSITVPAYPHSVAPARRLDGCPKQPEAMPLFLVRKQMMQQQVPVMDERCGDAVSVGILVVALENAIVVELKNLCAR